MTLNVNVNGYVPDDQQDAITAEWEDTYSKAIQELALKGFNENISPPVCPYPTLTPDQFVDLEGEEFERLMAEVNHWFDLCKRLLGFVEAELEVRHREYKDIVREFKTALRDDAKLHASKKSDVPSETELKEAAERQPYPRQIEQRIAEITSQKKVLEGFLSSIERTSALLSRRVTIRGQDVDIHGRQHRSGPRRFSQ